MPLINRRPRNGLRSGVLQKIMIFTGENVSKNPPVESAHEQKIEKPTRCRLCIEEIQGCSSHKESKNKMKKSKQVVRNVVMPAVANILYKFVCPV